MPRCITNLFCTPRCPHHRHLQQRRLRSVHFFNQTPTTHHRHPQQRRLSVHCVNRTQPSSLAATKAATATLRPHLFLVSALFCASQCTLRHTSAARRTTRMQCKSSSSNSEATAAAASSTFPGIPGKCALLYIAVYTSSYICSASHCKNAVQKNEVQKQ